MATFESLQAGSAEHLRMTGDVSTSFAHIPSKIGDSIASIPTKVGETASRGMDNLAAGTNRGIENALNFVDQAAPRPLLVTPDGRAMTLGQAWRMQRQADMPRRGGGGSGPRGGSTGGNTPVNKSQEAYDRAQEAKQGFLAENDCSLTKRLLTTMWRHSVGGARKNAPNVSRSLTSTRFSPSRKRSAMKIGRAHV